MHFTPDSLPFGVAPRILIDCASQLKDLATFDRETFCLAIGAPAPEAEPVLGRLIVEGYVELNADGSLRPLGRLSQLAAAKVSAGLNRADADRLLQRVIFKAAQVNGASDRYPFRITCVAVFGSYLTSKPVLGDLDIAVQLAPRHARSTRAANEDWVGRELRDIRRSMVALRLGRPAAVSVHSFEELLALRTAYRVVFGVPPPI